MRTTYSEKLKDPRWQKKRLRVLERAGWACECCGATDKTLHVHHGFYLPGREPWEYTLEQLSSLCENCHDEATAALVALRESLSLFQGSDLPELLGFASGILLRDARIESAPCQSYEEASGLGAALGLSPAVIIALSTGGTLTRFAVESLARKAS